MNKDESKLQNFSQILKLRTAFKSVTQISWNISQIEKRFPLEHLSDNELSELLSVYKEQVGELKTVTDILSKLFDEENELETTDTDQPRA